MFIINIYYINKELMSDCIMNERMINHIYLYIYMNYIVHY